MSAGATTCSELIQRSRSDGRPSPRSRACWVTNTEEVLISRLRSYDEAAFEAVVTEQHAALIRMAMRYVANRETAEDVVQETWMAVVQGVNRFEGRSSLRTWICAILIHKAKDRGVREQHTRTFSDLEGEDDDYRDAIGRSRFQRQTKWPGYSAFPVSLWDNRTPETLLASKQVLACIEQAIETLPTTQKEVLILRDVHGVQTGEVCNKLNISEANLYVRLHRARERVRLTVKMALR
jgi:RNA polymerase sigma-70 factor (ECF subfamily)